MYLYASYPPLYFPRASVNSVVKGFASLAISDGMRQSVVELLDHD